MQIDKKLIAESFSRAAKTYDAFAFLQKEVASRTFERLSYMNVKPKKILDAGCGTGLCSRQLRDDFSRAKICAVDLAPGMIELAKTDQKTFKKIDYQVADIDSLPYEDNTFDIVFSSLTIQWVPNLGKTFSELNRVLKPGGLIIFSTLGPDTLYELKESWQSVDAKTHVNEFIDMHIVGDAVFNSNFENVVMDRDVITLTYQTMKGLMKDLKSIGAHNINDDRPKGMMGKTQYKKLENAYERFRKDGVLPATYEVIYGHAWKKSEPAPKDYHTYSVEIQEATKS